MMNIKHYISRIDFMLYIEEDEQSIREQYLYLGMHLGNVVQRLMRRGFAASDAERLAHKRCIEYEGCWGPEKYQEPGHHREERFKPGGDLFVGPCHEHVMQDYCW